MFGKSQLELARVTRETRETVGTDTADRTLAGRFGPDGGSAGYRYSWAVVMVFKTNTSKPRQTQQLS